MDRATREQIETWAADVGESDVGARWPGVVREAAPALITSWFVAACELADQRPEDLDAETLRRALLEHVARLDLPREVLRQAPDVFRDTLAELERQGRFADGREVGLVVAAARPAFERAVAGEAEPLTRPGPKVGRNDPCPCGSGRKFKRCCMVR